MNLTSDFPFWLLRNGLVCSYPSLDHDLLADVVIIGGGITGAILFDRLTQEGLQAVVVDRRDICSGSTSASTALLQYEIDVPLVEMRELIGEERAARAYLLSHQSIDKLEELANSLQEDVGFFRKTSIHMAETSHAALKLENEASARRAIGIDVEYHDRISLKNNFRLDGVAALSSPQAASCDPYRLAHALIKRGVGRGGQAFDRTEIIDCIQAGREYVLTASTGHCLRAQHVVYATGYEAHSMVREYIVDLDNTYALVSEPLVNVYPWNPDWLLWEAKTPYLYLRVTEDNRLLVGGEDDAFHSPTQRDKLIEQKAATIEQKVRELMPDLHWKVDYRWAGTFGKTKDGLAYIGSPKETPGILFALCFGGNGITFSAIASDLISEFIHSGNSPDADLFAFGR